MKLVPIASTGVRLRRIARSVARHASDNVPLAVFTLPGVRQSFFRSFAIDRGLRTVQGDHGVLTMLADRERRELVVRDFPNVDFRFVRWVWGIVRPSGKVIAPERFE